MVAAFALLVLEGAAIPSLTTQANVVLGAISPHLVPVPQSLPGFVIADVLLLMSIHLSLGAAEPSKRLPLGTAPGGLRLIPLIPVMVIGVGAEAANLGNRFAGWRGPTAPLLLGIMLFAVCFMTLRLGSDGSMTARLSGLHMRFEDEVSVRRLSLWLAIYLLALPMWHTLAATDGMPGPDLPGALDALWVNLLYAVGAILFFGFGLHHIVWWPSARHLRTARRSPASWSRDYQCSSHSRRSSFSLQSCGRSRLSWTGLTSPCCSASCWSRR